MHKPFFIAVGLLVAIFLITTSCKEEAPLKLTAAQRDQLDTLFTKQVKELGVELDSLCDLLYKEELDRAVDSIISARKAQEEALRKKYQ